MSANLIHNGYNVERRKMYPSNPRNNLISTVDLVWQKSLFDENALASSTLKIKKQEQSENISDNYTKAIQAKMEQQMKLNKSTFRVMPVHQSLNNQQLKDSLTNELNSYRNRLKNSHEAKIHRSNQSPRQQIANVQISPKKSIQNSSLVGTTVFGYNINYENYKRESYFSKLLSERLEPYLNYNTQKEKMPKHRSFTVNALAPIYYD